ncbi:MAG: hypothetical protein IPQ09_05365 [Myxococcales bacterium]|nr:hypothetical protein [Myxococcales bacterium]
MALFSLLAAGCERGCLARALTDRAGEPQAQGVDLGGTDCPAGVVRCRAGELERAVGGHLPAVCRRPEGCACPTERAGECSALGMAPRCLLEDAWVELSMGHEAALCVGTASRAVPVDGVVGVLVPNDAPARVPTAACDSDDARCVDGALVRCHPAPRVVARCLRGCAGPGGVDPDTSDEALQALCAR